MPINWNIYIHQVEESEVNKISTYRPLVKQEPLPAPKEDIATAIGIIAAAAPNRRVPHVCGKKR